MLVLHHIHKRKISKKKASNNFFDDFMYFISIGGPVMTIPQVYDIWVKRDTAVNILTWESYIFFACVWLFYGLVHKVKPIIISNVLWIIVEVLVVTGVIMHR